MSPEAETSTNPTTLSEAPLVLTRDALYDALKIVMGVVEQSQVLPILSFVKISAKDSTLHLSATDSSIQLNTSAPLHTPISHEFNVALPGKKLLDICKNLPGDSILSLSEQQNWVVIASQHAQFTLATLPSDTFPSLSHEKHEKQHTVLESELFHLLHRTAFAMAHQDVRFYLNGLFIEIGSDSIRTIATDGHRLSINEINKQTIQAQASSAIVPRKSIFEIMRLLTPNSEALLDVTLTDNQICIQHPSFTLYSNLISGDYPDCMSLIPSNTQAPAIIDSALLKQALLRASIISSDKFRSAKLEFSPNTLSISSLNTDHEKTNETIAMVYEGQTMTIAFNIQYLIDVLSITTCEKISLSLTDPEHSILIEEHDTEHNSRFIIMPLTL